MGGLVSRSLEAPDERRDFPHGARVEGDEPCVLLDWTGMTRYAK